MKEIGKYNTELKLFQETLPPVNKGRLKFMRWLGVHGLLEHPIAGRPTGDLALAAVAQEGRAGINPMSKTELLRRHLVNHGDY